MRKIFRVFISRYALSALFITAEIALIAYLAFYAYTYSFAFVLISGIVNTLVIISLINQDTNPEFKLTWLAVVVMIPILGGVLYIMFHSRRMTKRESVYIKSVCEKIKAADEENLSRARSTELLGELSRACDTGAGAAVAVMKDDPLSQIYACEHCEYYDSGEAFFESLLKALEDAEKYIFLEYFIIEDGKMWQSIYKILKEKVALGVEVRVLYDDIGSMGTVSADFDKRLRREGIECYRFSKVTPRFSASYNNRDHRKICVIDGRVAFTGGLNIADEYINEKVRFGHWKDGGIKTEGAAALGFARLFLMLYDFTTGKHSDYGKYLSFEADECAHAQGGFLIPFGSGPAPIYPERVGKNALMNIINSSKGYLYITTPYLIIDYDITEAIRAAARRGVDVRIITPGIADKKIVKIMTKSSYPYLIRAGVRIFEYLPGFIHEKLIVSDDKFAVVSTINFDYRSLVHHFEDGLWICGGSVVEQIRESFMKTEGASGEILPSEAKMGFGERIIRNLIRIFAPLL